MCLALLFYILLSFLQHLNTRGFIIFDDRTSAFGHREFRTNSKSEGPRIILWLMGFVRLRIWGQFSVLG